MPDNRRDAIACQDTLTQQNEEKIDNTTELEKKTAELYSEIHTYTTNLDTKNIMFTHRIYDECRLGVDKNFLKNKRVLDAGCGGQGVFIRVLYECGARDIFAVDLSAENINNASVANSDISSFVKFHQMNLLENDFDDNYFDHINCNGVVHHTSNPQTAVAGLMRNLSPNGTIFLSVYGRGGLLSAFVSISRALFKFIPFNFTSSIIRRMLNPWTARDVLDFFYVPYLHRFSEEEAMLLLTNCGASNIRRLPPQSAPANASLFDRYFRSAYADHKSLLGRVLFGHGWIVLFARK
jgi:2-polyprenyl-3-methyl-5-hydroxy-6-metoxy-1,4-benzoquinol methylase